MRFNWVKQDRPDGTLGYELNLTTHWKAIVYEERGLPAYANATIYMGCSRALSDRFRSISSAKEWVEFSLTVHLVEASQVTAIVFDTLPRP